MRSNSGGAEVSSRVSETTEGNALSSCKLPLNRALSYRAPWCKVNVEGKGIAQIMTSESCDRVHVKRLFIWSGKMECPDYPGNDEEEVHFCNVRARTLITANHTWYCEEKMKDIGIKSLLMNTSWRSKLTTLRPAPNVYTSRAM